jgi:glycosyltransferase involved in cell wall biosynthesis
MNSERILIIGSKFQDLFEISIKKNKWNYFTISYNISRKRDFTALLISKLFKNLFSINDFIAHKLNQKIIENFKSIKRFRPTRILILRGFKFKSSTLELLKSLDAPFYLWTYDSVNRYNDQIIQKEIYEKIFVIDENDTKINNKVRWCPIGFVDKYFYPESNKLFDVVFIGRIDKKKYKSRYEFLKRIDSLEIAKSRKFVFIGTTGSFLKDISLKFKLKNIKFLGKQNYSNYTSIIRKSRICINIHQDDGVKPVNPMFLGIAGAKVCQITDKRDYLDNWFKPDKEYVPCNLMDIEDKLCLLLNNHRLVEDISTNAYKRAVHQYSLDNQLRILFDIDDY